MATREEIIQRYVPLLHTNVGRAVEGPLTELRGCKLQLGEGGYQFYQPSNAEENNLITSLADMLAATQRLQGKPIETNEFISSLYDQPSYRELFTKAYSGAERAFASDTRPMGDLGVAVPLSAVLPTSPSSAIDTTATADPDAALKATTEFTIQKNRLIKLLNDGMDSLTIKAAADEQSAVNWINDQKKKGMAEAAAIDQKAVELVKARGGNNKYTKLYQAKKPNDTAWDKLKSDEGEKARDRYTPRSYTGWKGTFRNIFSALPILAIFEFVNIVMKAYKDRSEGKRTWKNFLGVAGAMFTLMYVGSIISSSLFGISFMGPLLTPITAIVAKLAAVTFFAAIAANPVGAALLGAFIALVLISFVAVAAYKIHKAIYGKKPEQEIEASANISDDIKKLYEKNGYDLDTVRKAIRDLAERERALEAMNPDGKKGTELKEELAKVKKQLQALRGHPTGVLAALGMSTSKASLGKSLAKRWATAEAALTEYAENHAARLGATKDTLFIATDLEKQEAAQAQAIQAARAPAANTANTAMPAPSQTPTPNPVSTPIPKPAPGPRVNLAADSEADAANPQARSRSTEPPADTPRSSLT